MYKAGRVQLRRRGSHFQVGDLNTPFRNILIQPRPSTPVQRLAQAVDKLSSRTPRKRAFRYLLLLLSVFLLLSSIARLGRKRPLDRAGATIQALRYKSHPPGGGAKIDQSRHPHRDTIPTRSHGARRRCRHHLSPSPRRGPAQPPSERSWRRRG